MYAGVCLCLVVCVCHFVIGRLLLVRIGLYGFMFV